MVAAARVADDAALQSQVPPQHAGSTSTSTSPMTALTSLAAASSIATNPIDAMRIERARARVAASFIAHNDTGLQVLLAFESIIQSFSVSPLALMCCFAGNCIASIVA